MGSDFQHTIFSYYHCNDKCHLSSTMTDAIIAIISAEVLKDGWWMDMPLQQRAWAILEISHIFLYDLLWTTFSGWSLICHTSGREECVERAQNAHCQVSAPWQTINNTCHWTSPNKGLQCHTPAWCSLFLMPFSFSPAGSHQSKYPSVFPPAYYGWIFTTETLWKTAGSSQPSLTIQWLTWAKELCGKRWRFDRNLIWWYMKYSQFLLLTCY